MDPIKKRKLEEKPESDTDPKLTSDDIRKMMEPLTQDQLLDILESAALKHLDVLDSVRSIADHDPSQRKLFIRGLGWDTTSEHLRTLFSTFGELIEAIVILDKATAKSKGFGFITFKHIDGAMLALKEPSKIIDGRVTVTQLASAGTTAANPQQVDVSTRKIYVANVPHDMPAERLLAHFGFYGEIEEGPLGFDKTTGKSKGFALFVYKTSDGARASLVDPIKTIDGHPLNCKLAINGIGNRDKPGMPAPLLQTGAPLNPPPSSVPGPQYHPAGVSPYAGFSGVRVPPQGPSPLTHHPMNLSAPLGSGGYGSGMAGPYGLTGYGGGGVYGGVAGGLVGAGRGSSLYGLVPPSAVGLPSGGYPEGLHYSLSGFQPQHHQMAAALPVPRGPPAEIYQGMPHYFRDIWLKTVAAIQPAFVPDMGMPDSW